MGGELFVVMSIPIAKIRAFSSSNPVRPNVPIVDVPRFLKAAIGHVDTVWQASRNRGAWFYNGGGSASVGRTSLIWSLVEPFSLTGYTRTRAERERAFCQACQRHGCRVCILNAHRSDPAQLLSVGRATARAAQPQHHAAQRRGSAAARHCGDPGPRWLQAVRRQVGSRVRSSMNSMRKWQLTSAQLQIRLPPRQHTLVLLCAECQGGDSADVCAPAQGEAGGGRASRAHFGGD